MKIINLLSAVCVCLLVSISSSASAAIIDFETQPNGSGSTDNTALGLNDAYVIDGVSVTFGFDADNDGVTDTEAIFEQAGDTDTTRGFLNDVLGQFDTADPGFESQLGNYFLRKQGNINSDFGTFIIDYTSSTPVTAASGEIWDIDGGGLGDEQYQIQAFDSNNSLLATIISPLGNDLTLDGRPFTFGFSGLSGIDQIRIDFISQKSKIGLAFNNFSPTTTVVPVPAAIWLFGSGMLGLIGVARRKNAA